MGTAQTGSHSRRVKLNLTQRRKERTDEKFGVRNKVLEQLLGDDLAQVRGITEKAMFGGWAWLLNGNLLCGARHDGMLVRLGKGNDAWALATPGIAPMITQGRPMHGWIRATPEVYEDDALRRNLLKAALNFTRSLPKK
jgi:hypothetical protein